MADLIIRNGTLLDPATGAEQRGDLVIAGGRIIAWSAAGHAAPRELDAEGLLVTPGFIDPHVHLREPGKEAAETIATGAAAALAGGYTAIVAMPNTTPPLDTAERIRWQAQRGREARGARVFPAACVTTRRAGFETTDFSALARAGAAAFTDDGNGVADAAVMRRALEAAREVGLPIMSHCEEPTLSQGGVMHEGGVSAALGLPGMPAAAEEVMAARDIALAQAIGARLHLQHVSSAGTVELIRAAKQAGASVSAEATPHHLLLTDEAVRSGNADCKMNPPLRTPHDREVLRRAFRDGVLDCIATDHAPHTAAEKRQGFLQAPFGCIGLESAFAALWTDLVIPGVVTAQRLIAGLTIAPARILGLPYGSLAVGSPADVTLIDPRRRWRIDPEKFRSRARNCPFADAEVTGRVVAAIVGGVILYELSET